MPPDFHCPFWDYWKLLCTGRRILQLRQPVKWLTLISALTTRELIGMHPLSLRQLGIHSKSSESPGDSFCTVVFWRWNIYNFSELTLKLLCCLAVLSDKQAQTSALWAREDLPAEVSHYRVPACLLCGRMFWGCQRESPVKWLQWNPLQTLPSAFFCSY